MEEIASNLFIEHHEAGVVTGILKLSRGLLVIDSPLKADDRLAWQQHLAQYRGEDRQIMVMLDTHPDRLLGAQMIDMPILAHENALGIIQDLPAVQRALEMQTRKDSESHDQAANVRWPVPDMTYSHQISIQWDDDPVLVMYQPGGHMAGSWVRYDAGKVIFVGDSVVMNQPPFLAWCDLDRWIDELTWLSSDKFKGYKIISSRNGLVRQRSLQKMIDLLTTVRESLGELAGMENRDEAMAQLSQNLLQKLSFDRDLYEQYKSRLVWGLKKLLQRYDAI